MDEIKALTEAMPARLALSVPLASFCALRFGEMSELRRKDIDLRAGVLRIRRGVVHVGRQGYIVGQPKSAAGIRDVAVPPHLIPMIETHLKDYVGVAREALIVTSPTVAGSAPPFSSGRGGRPETRSGDRICAGTT